MPSSFRRDNTIPSGIISDGAITVPLYAVTSISLSESYHLPPIGTSGMKAVVATHDDTISLTGLLLGPDRYAWKAALETLAETSKRGGRLAAVSGGAISGLILVTSMTIRTDMQVQTLNFGATASQRDIITVSITLAHMPRPSVLGKLLDLASIRVAALADMGGN